MPTITVSQLAARLSQEEPFLSTAVTPVKSRAMVGCIVRPGSEPGQSAEMLTILRAIRDGDPWSGQTAFPGGRCEVEDDGDDLATVIREVREEVGINLADETHYRLLGRVCDIEIYRRGRIHMVIGCLVFEQLAPDSLTLDPREVSASGWVPLSLIGYATSDDLHNTYWTVPRGWGLPSYLHGYLELTGLNRVALATLPIVMRDAVKARPDVAVDDLSLWGITLQFSNMIARDGNPLRLYRKLPVLGMRIPRKFNSIVHDLLVALYHSTYNRRGLRDGSAMHLSYFCFFHGILACLIAAAAGAAYIGLRSRL
ncbi:hypothetical protein FOZ63_018803 [Perkinsus olseni]|uniref:Nudix hydrolase domain-containing protein n=2 Tax=Perkinsus olseni TaxID=32597 RepID=A0A7J6Q9B0_PEROL|nr:hypothetical protein FOZ63_018803 [Perkinsus olseni]